MKYLKGLLTACVILSLMIFMSCGNGKKTTPDPEGKLTGEQLSAGTWTPQAGGVTVGGTPRSEWDNFTLSFTVNTTSFEGGSYSTTGVPTDDGASDVWRTSGSWEFLKDSEGNVVVPTNTIIRDGDDSVPVTVNVDVVLDDEGNATGDGQLTLSFTIPAPEGRVAGFDGPWVFTFDL